MLSLLELLYVWFNCTIQFSCQNVKIAKHRCWYIVAISIHELILRAPKARAQFSSILCDINDISYRQDWYKYLKAYLNLASNFYFVLAKMFPPKFHSRHFGEWLSGRTLQTKFSLAMASWRVLMSNPAFIYLGLYLDNKLITH